MAQATFSCRCAAIHLETPFLGFFRNYLPSRHPTFPIFFGSLPAAGVVTSAALFIWIPNIFK
jgi:hypothetical protein